MNNKRLIKRTSKKIKEISNSVKKYFLNFLVLEERREKRKPGPFATQPTPKTSKMNNKKNVMERLLPKEPFTTTQITFKPSIEQSRKIVSKRRQSLAKTSNPFSIIFLVM